MTAEKGNKEEPCRKCAGLVKRLFVYLWQVEESGGIVPDLAKLLVSIFTQVTSRIQIELLGRNPIFWVLYEFMVVCGRDTKTLPVFYVTHRKMFQSNL